MKEYVFIAAIAYLLSTHKFSLDFRNKLWNRAMEKMPHLSGGWTVKNKWIALVYGLVSCPFCLGFWQGVIWNLFNFKSIQELLIDSFVCAIASTVIVKAA